MDSVVTPRPPGRPRDDTATLGLLDAARDLVIAQGYRAVTIDAIAAQAGVARQTLYRRWSSKAELVLDAFFESAGAMAVEGSGSGQGRLTAFLEILFRNLERDGPAIRSLIASAQEDAGFLAIFRERFTRPRAEMVRQLLGEVTSAAPVALDTAIDALHGAFWYRLLQDEPLDARFAAALAAFVMRGLDA